MTDKDVAQFDEAGYVTGEAINVSGGEEMH